jgi:hypothetical protein
MIARMTDEVEMVEDFLKAQNLEQLGRLDEALELYEAVIAGGFDAIGPYDRLIHLYGHQSRHADVVRVAELALVQVRTYEDKRKWYELMRLEAKKAATNLPTPVPRDGDG